MPLSFTPVLRAALAAGLVAGLAPAGQAAPPRVGTLVTPMTAAAAAALPTEAPFILEARRGRGQDDPAGHVRRGRGQDDPAGDNRRGRGTDDPVGHG